MTDGVASGTAPGMEEAVKASLATLDGEERDQAAAELARQYAAEIDLGGDMTKLGPALLACLTSLLLTPAARAAAKKGAGGDVTPEPANPLDGLRDEVADQRRKRDAG